MKVKYLKISNFRGIKKFQSKIDGNFVCIIGHGDTGKSTILTAIEYALSSRWNLNFDDTDFYKQNTDEPISIEVTVSDWDIKNKFISKLLSEDKFGQYIGGISSEGLPTDEPLENGLESLTIQLKVDHSLEPKWHVIKGNDFCPISASDRTMIGVGRIDNYLDQNFTWNRNSILTKLLDGSDENIATTLTQISRTARNHKIELSDCDSVTKQIKDEAVKFGVKINELTTVLDIQKLSMNSGTLALHEDKIPLRNFGSGSKRLLTYAMQMHAKQNNFITLIDELEIGLEPHRIRGLIKKLKKSNQQIITTTHSPVVLRELEVKENELYSCKRNQDDETIELVSFSKIPESQGPIRSNAEAFLGKKIIVCEGATEIGLLRSLDKIMTEKNQSSIPTWTLNTAYYNAGGGSKIKKEAKCLHELGYEVAILCDNDLPDELTQEDLNKLNSDGISTFLCEKELCIEEQLFKDIPWEEIDDLFDLIEEVNDEKTKEGLIQSVRSKFPSLGPDLKNWKDEPEVRAAIGSAAAGRGKDGKSENKKSWLKRIDYAEEIFNFSIGKLPAESHLSKNLEGLWKWIQT